MSLWRVVWWWLRLNLKLSALVLLVVLALGCVAHTHAGMGWIVSTPLLTLTDPHTGEVLHKLQPVRVVAMTGHLLVDVLWQHAAALLGRYL